MEKTVLAIAGKPGLYTLVKQGRGMLIVESIDETRKRIPAAARDRVTSLNDVSMYTHKKMKTDGEKSLKVLEDVLPILEAQDDFSNDALYARLSQYVSETGVKTGFVMWPIRTAVSGKQMTPAGATEILEVLGKEESLKRIQKGIELLSEGIAD